MIDMQGGMELALGNGARSHLFKISIDLPIDLFENSYMQSSNINTLCKASTIPGCRISQRAFHTTGGHIINIPSNKIYDTEWTGTFYLDDFYSIRVLMEKWVALLDSFNGQRPGDIKTQSSILGGLANAGVNLASDAMKSLSISALSNRSTFDSISASDYSKGISSTPMVSNTLGNFFLGEISDSATYVQRGLNNFKESDNKSYLGTINITQMSITGAEIITYKLNNAYPILLSPINFNDTSIDSINEFTCSFSFTDYEILSKSSFTSDAVSSVYSTVSSAIYNQG